MREPGRGTSLSIVGWLWADILLGLFALFLAANTAASSASNQTTPGVDPKDIELTVAVDPAILLNGTPDAIAQEQQRIADVAVKSLQTLAPGRKVAIVLAYGVFDDPVLTEISPRPNQAEGARQPSTAIPRRHHAAAAAVVGYWCGDL